MDDDDKVLIQMMEATAICEGLRLFIDKLKTEDNQRDEAYKSLLAFVSNLHWRYYKIQTLHEVESDLFGRLRIKRDDNRMNCN
jgi:hypothetical protein